MKNNLITKFLGIVVLGMLCFNFAYSQDCTNINLKKPEYQKVITYLINGYLDCRKTKIANFYAMDGNLNCDKLKKVEKKKSKKLLKKKRPTLEDMLTSKIMVDAIKASFPDLENTLKSELKHPDKNVESFLWCAINRHQGQNQKAMSIKPVDFECLNICKDSVKGMTIAELNSFCMMRCQM